jgi:flagellar M-ring protein FliF
MQVAGCVMGRLWLNVLPRTAVICFEIIGIVANNERLWNITMDKLKDVLEQFGQRWEVLSFAQKITLGTLLIGLILVAVFVFKQAQEDYDVLYADLNLTDAAAIAAKLREEKQDFKLADGGTTILVPASRKNSLVLDTVGELSGEKPVSLSQIPPVVSGDVQREWLRTLNTNAIITILKSIRGIKEAQVIVSQPEKNLFLENDEEPRASVMLTVEPGMRLREEQIKTIKHLVYKRFLRCRPSSACGIVGRKHVFSFTWYG